MTKKISTQQILVIVGIIVTLAINFLAANGYLNGLTPPEISDRLMNKFTPDNAAFGIWGIIYSFVIGFAIYQVLPSQRDNPKLTNIRGLFIASCVLNTVWSVVWHYELFALSLLFMVGILLTMIGIYVRSGIGKPEQSWAQRILVHIPFSLYLSWISVATIANFSAVLTHYGWSGFGLSGSLWSAIMILVAAVVGVLLLFNRANLAYAAVYVWAVYWITVRYSAEIPIVTAAYVGMAVVSIVAVLGWIRFINSGGSRRKLAVG